MVATLVPACQTTTAQVVGIQVVVDDLPPLTPKVPSLQPVRTATLIPASLLQTIRGGSADAITENIAGVGVATGGIMG